MQCLGRHSQQMGPTTALGTPLLRQNPPGATAIHLQVISLTTKHRYLNTGQVGVTMSMSLLQHTLDRIRPLDEAAMATARARQDQLTKPLGALGRLEALSVQIAGITGALQPPLERKAVIVMAADHGVARSGRQCLPPGSHATNGAELPARRGSRKTCSPSRQMCASWL